ncbi:succinyl-diaminopimelate desuccinylase [Jatrophihabitans sp. YIM 134969]
MPQPLDPTADGVALTAALVDVWSVSGTERELADLVEQALRGLGGALAVERDGDVVLARTETGAATRVALAGHLDTVPVADNFPSRLEGDRLWGCGSTDMKSGLAVMLRIAAAVARGELRPACDLTWVFYDGEEVEAARNGLGRLARERPKVLAADAAVLLEGTDGLVEAGCQGTLRAVATASGHRAHSARSWKGVNAIHRLAPVLDRLAAYEARVVEIDGCTYREGMNAVRVEGGVAGNVVPDAATLTVNHRFAPDRTVERASSHLLETCSAPGVTVEIVDAAPAAPPGLTHPFARALVAATPAPPRAKLGWTDVARFTELGIPAVNFGPGDPELAHTREEYVTTSRIAEVEHALTRVLAAGF